MFHGVSFHGCAVGLTDENGSPIKKPWHIKTTSKALAEAVADRQCAHTKSEKHTPAAGSRTSRTAFYPEQMCGLIAKALYPKVCRTPVQAMPVVPVTQQTVSSFRSMTSPSSLNQTLRQKRSSKNSWTSKVYSLVLSAYPQGCRNRSACNGHQTPVPCRDACIS